MKKHYNVSGCNRFQRFMGTPLTVFRFRLQFKDSAFSCIFRNCVVLLYTYLYFLWLMGFTECSGFVHWPVLRAILSDKLFWLVFHEVQNSKKNQRCLALPDNFVLVLLRTPLTI